MAREYVQVTMTVPSRDDADRIGRALVERRLAACVQTLGPISSTYWWKGALETADEFLCLLKTRCDLFPALEAAIREMHPYEVPEIVAMPIVEGSRAYLDWMEEETRQQ